MLFDVFEIQHLFIYFFFNKDLLVGNFFKLAFITGLMLLSVNIIKQVCNYFKSATYIFVDFLSKP